MRGIHWKEDPSRSNDYVSWINREHLFAEAVVFLVMAGLLMAKMFGLI